MKTAIIRVLAALLVTGSLPALAGLSTTARAITFVDEHNARRIFAFARGTDGHLWLDHFNGSTWTWIDHGLPSGATSVTDQQPITYIDDTLKRRIYVFAVDNNKHLALRYWNGSQWQWVSQGGPEIKRTFGSLSVITYVDDAGKRRIYCFAIRQSDSHLVTNYWNGSSWQWADLGSHQTHTGKIYEPLKTKAITFAHRGTRFISVFSVTSDYQDHLWLLYNSGIPDLPNSEGWMWSDLGGRPMRSFAPLTFIDELGERHQYVFWGTYQDAQSELWLTKEVTGSPYFAPFSIVKAGSIPTVDPALPMSNMSAITFPDVGGGQMLYAFMEVDGRLFGMPASPDTSWSWELQGAPAGYAVSHPEAITYVGSDGVRRIHVFMYGQGRGNALFTKTWNGTMWQWTNLGAPP
jgi:hypothetical protein